MHPETLISNKIFIYLLQTKQLTSELSPFKRWGQSSLRSRTGESRTLQRRPASLVTSDNDVYSKAIDDDDDFCSVKSGQTSDSKQIVYPTGPGMWGQSFEFLLNDPAGLHTFAVSISCHQLIT